MCDRLDLVEKRVEVLLYNPYHDQLGRFAGRLGAISVSPRTKQVAKRATIGAAAGVIIGGTSAMLVGSVVGLPAVTIGSLAATKALMGGLSGAAAPVATEYIVKPLAEGTS